MASKNSNISFEAGCATSSTIFYTAASIDDLGNTDLDSFSRMNFYQDLTKEKWFFHDLPNWRVVSTCFIPENAQQPRTVVALDEEGNIEFYSRNGSVVEKISDAGVANDSKGYGYLTRLRFLNGVLYACGLSGQVYVRNAGKWLHKDNGLLQSPPSTVEGVSQFIENNISLNDLGMLPDGRLVAVGDSGLIAQFTEEKWKVFNLNFDEDLNCLFVEDAQEIWICGFNGALLKGNFSDGFKDLSSVDENNYFQSICKFEGIIYLGASDGIFQYDGYKIRKSLGTENFDLDQVVHVEACDGVLWALSSKKLLRFDGKQWDVFAHPDNL